MNEAKVKLISYSQIPSFQEQPIKTMTELVAYCARVSNPTNQEITNLTKDERLLEYLIRNHHWSPFEMVNICLEITTTRDIARQILRHRSFSFQEFSQRYAVYDTETTPFMIRDARLQDTKNRQNSIEMDFEKEENQVIIEQWRTSQQKIIDMTNEIYNWAIQSGIAKEQARSILPEGMTVSKIYMNGTLRSWIYYIELRSGNGTQKEHREIAVECGKVISTIFPMILQVLSKDV
jgi:thymidylate synthase (FAD)